jgi:hypothetical protein
MLRLIIYQMENVDLEIKKTKTKNEINPILRVKWFIGGPIKLGVVTDTLELEQF